MFHMQQNITINATNVYLKGQYTWYLGISQRLLYICSPLYHLYIIHLMYIR
jgi:hypothetical protein